MSVIKIEDFTIIAMPTLSGMYECKIYKNRCLETRTRGKRLRYKGFPSFLAESPEDAKRKVIKEFGIDQTKLEEFI